jgi:hypothetical protein
MTLTVILCNALLQCVGIQIELTGIHGSCEANRPALERVLRDVPVPPGWFPAGVRCVVEVPA